MGIYYIYFHRNPVSNAIFYVGLGTGNRAYDTTKGKGRTQHYVNYIKKHGYPIIEFIHNNLTLEQAYYYERFYIKLYGRVGYEPYGILINKSEGGESGSKGTKWSQESIDNRNKKLIGRKFSEEHKEKISLSKQNHPSYKNRKSNKKVIQYDINGVLLKEFNTILEACVFIGSKYGSQHIINCCKGKIKHYKNFIWKYK